MPQIVKLNDFTSSDTRENKYGKFEKVYFKKIIKLENINKNGYIQLEYDINDNPYLEINSNHKKLVLTSKNITVDNANFDKILLKNEDLECTIKNLLMKINCLESKVEELENTRKVVHNSINEDFCDELYLIEFKNPYIGLYGIFTLNDNKKYLYICYNIDKNISYWKLIHHIIE